MLLFYTISTDVRNCYPVEIYLGPEDASFHYRLSGIFLISFEISFSRFPFAAI